MASVTLTNLGKTFANGVEALRDLSLAVANGELLVLVGPSGCGKSTTLRLIAGLETPTQGAICIGDRTVNGLPPRARNVALVFQRPALYPHLGVRDNLAFALRLQNWFGWRPTADETQKVCEAAKALGLENVLDRRPAELSGGEQQRVALGRALVRRPDLFLLDEPLSSLDTPVRAEMRRDLHLLQRRLGTTMIYVTHDQVEALTLGDRVGVLQRGVLQQIDRPTALYDRPCNRFVAGFIGWPSMNLLEGELARKDGRLCFLAPGVEWVLPRADAPQGGERQVTLGVRPEDVRLAVTAEPGLVMEVVLVESLGATCLVTLQRNGWQMLALFAGRNSIEVGQSVSVDVNMQRIHLFDAKTGMALGQSCRTG